MAPGIMDYSVYVPNQWVMALQCKEHHLSLAGRIHRMITVTPRQYTYQCPPKSVMQYVTRGHLVNSLSPEKCGRDFKNVIFSPLWLIGIFKLSLDNALRWMPQDRTDDKSTMVQVMAWCRQATSHYLSQCWPRSMAPYGITRPQLVIAYAHCNSKAFVQCMHG